MPVSLGKVLEKVSDKTRLRIVSGEEFIPDSRVESERVNLLGLELAGCLGRVNPGRLQVLEPGALDYLNSHPGEAPGNLGRVLASGAPLLVLTDGSEVPGFLDGITRKESVTVGVTPLSRYEFVRVIEGELEKLFAPETDYRGTMLEVYGVGVLITGKSNMGKSECAIDLLQRGHRIIGDDLVRISKRGTNVLLAKGKPPISHRMELRGIGIIDIVRLMGVSAVKDVQKVELIAALEKWHIDKSYDRLGLDEKYREILGVNIPYIEIPVAPGRNTAILVEVCAMNYRLRRKGIVPARELELEVMDFIERKNLEENPG